MRKKINRSLKTAPPIPSIEPIFEEGKRPLWSVMIPVHNERDYMKRALSSVLAQDPGEGHMQIKVVDDASSDPGIEEAVKKLAGDRVEYFRLSMSRGHINTFNQCITLSRGHLVHILHSDDQVEFGFYSSLQPAFEHDEVAAAFCRTEYVDESDRLIALTGLEQETAGIMPHFSTQIVTRHFVLSCSMVIRRSTYERTGGYWPAIDSYEDWDLYKRVSLHGSVWYEPKALARYCLKKSSIAEYNIQTYRTLFSMGMSIEHFRRSIAPQTASEWSREAWINVYSFVIKTARLMMRRKRYRLAWGYACRAWEIRPHWMTVLDLLRLLRLQLHPAPATVRLAIDHAADTPILERQTPAGQTN